MTCPGTFSRVASPLDPSCAHHGGRGGPCTCQPRRFRALCPACDHTWDAEPETAGACVEVPPHNVIEENAA